ncbi:probable inactive receptor-like protein kinase At3g56050 [Impatiens glandulifera]|uniref:probable inactive receptor-like protein kinase At3g56050 n=1 Tax=Impatiens glandulifera TaxID=253017 RepID=UPI001FB10960|nr:probable inactive receptor-like protein kinase At3g56050 [Impatiens glandulifera]
MICNGFKFHVDILLAILVLFLYGTRLCCSLNSEGQALLRFKERMVRDPYGVLLNWNDGMRNVNPCSWFGVGCIDGKVITLSLNNLCLEGTVSPEIGKLAYLKSINLRNNSLRGRVPGEIGKLKELQVLDLGYNNFTGPFPTDILNHPSLSILLLDNNKFLDCLSPEIQELKMLSEFQVDENDLTRSSSPLSVRILKRRLLQAIDASSQSSLFPLEPHISLSLSPSVSPSESFAPSHPPSASTSQPGSGPSISIVSPPPDQSSKSDSNPKNRTMIWCGIAGGSLFIVAFSVGIFLCGRNKMVMVRPWVTELSGKLKKAFLTGVPKLQRLELEIACEDFSNIIGSLSDDDDNEMVYKGTLSSGVEIAVISSVPIKSTAEDHWSKSLETQFRNKIETLSRVNHKNFVNLIGFCEEEQPFTRMMVFEYVPNGTLFEHLHIREAERLDWGARLRIAMGIAYCLQHMHKLAPPISHGNLKSSSVFLTEDYATKLSDFSYCNEVTDPGSDVYNFGVILLEIITGRFPYSLHEGSSLAEWTNEYLSGERSIREAVDPTLKSFDDKLQQIEKLFQIIRECIIIDNDSRNIVVLTMEEVTARMKEITSLSPEGVTPTVSPLWWAELEIMSTEVC